MKILCLLLVMISLSFSLTAFADCPEGDRNCTEMKAGGSGTMAQGIGCSACTAFEKAKTLRGTTDTIFRGSSQNSNSSPGTPVDVDN